MAWGFRLRSFSWFSSFYTLHISRDKFLRLFFCLVALRECRVFTEGIFCGVGGDRSSFVFFEGAEFYGLCVAGVLHGFHGLFLILCFYGGKCFDVRGVIEAVEICCPISSRTLTALTRNFRGRIFPIGALVVHTKRFSERIRFVRGKVAHSCALRSKGRVAA